MTALDDLKKEVTALQTELKALSKQVVIVGTIVPYGDESGPGDGWLLCDGRSLDRGEYPALYQVIGANFGAPDETHFNLPDLRGRFVRGWDHGAGRDPDAEKRTEHNHQGHTGDKVGSVQEDACQSHTHQYTTQPRFFGEGKGGRDYLFGITPHSLRQWVGNGLHVDKTGSPDESVRSSTETRPKNVYVNWIIYAGPFDVARSKSE